MIKKYSKKQMDELKKMSHSELKKLGFGIFDKEKGYVHYLYPGNFYKKIPNGYEVISIFDKKIKWDQRKMDNDTRYGCLPYGFKIKEK